MCQVCIPRLAVYEDVIEENQDELSEKGPEQVIHETLEGSRSIRQAEGHDQKLEVTIVCAECRLVNIGRLHSNLMVAGAQVEFAKEHSTSPG